MPTIKLSKAEARLKRKIAKQTKSKEKNVRLIEKVPVTDRLIRSEVPDIIKIPRGVDSLNYKDRPFEWNISRADLLGDWSWGEPRCWSDEEYLNIVERHFNAQLNNTWQQVEAQTYNGSNGKRKRCNKYQPIDSLTQEAQLRWMENDELAQFEHLFRCRLGTNRRVWGIRVTNHYFLVWYERYHNICPIDDKD